MNNTQTTTRKSTVIYKSKQTSDEKVEGNIHTMFSVFCCVERTCGFLQIMLCARLSSYHIVVWHGVFMNISHTMSHTTRMNIIFSTQRVLNHSNWIIHDCHVFIVMYIIKVSPIQEWLANVDIYYTTRISLRAHTPRVHG